MLDGGLIELGAHTHSHGQFLGRCNEFRRDITLCLDVLRGRFGIERPSFAFPYGDTSPDLVEAARQLGVICGLTTRQKSVVPGDDAHQWGRYFAGGGDSAAILAGKLSGWYTALTTSGKSFASPFVDLTWTPRRPNGNGLSEAVRGATPAAREGLPTP
jgi:hypothetical protein